MSPVWRGGALNTTLDFAKLVIIAPVMVMAVNTATAVAPAPLHSGCLRRNHQRCRCVKAGICWAAG